VTTPSQTSAGAPTGDPAIDALWAMADRQPKPIVDTHIHLFDVDRPGGVPWPGPDNPHLYRSSLPAGYEEVARPLGIIASGIVEASPLQGDTRWVLDRVAGNPFFPFYVAQLEIGSPEFLANLAEIAADPRVVGVRGFLWSPAAGITLDGAQLEHLRALARHGMILELVSRHGVNPKEKIERLAQAVPELRIIIDHLAGARGSTPDAGWLADVRRVGAHRNVHIKFSSFFDMFNPSPTGDESVPWLAPRDLAPYRAHFDALYEAFGPDRLIFGSNYPVVAMGGSLADEIALAEAFLADKGKAARDQVMCRNALLFYRRLPPR
jgi:L-fuconolactonase